MYLTESMILQKSGNVQGCVVWLFPLPKCSLNAQRWNASLAIHLLNLRAVVQAASLRQHTPAWKKSAEMGETRNSSWCLKQCSLKSSSQTNGVPGLWSSETPKIGWFPLQIFSCPSSHLSCCDHQSYDICFILLQNWRCSIRKKRWPYPNIS